MTFIKFPRKFSTKVGVYWSSIVCNGAQTFSTLHLEDYFVFLYGVIRWKKPLLASLCSKQALGVIHI